MKTIIKILILMTLITQLFSCKSYYGFSKSELEVNYKFVDYIMNNIDSLKSIFNDNSKFIHANDMSEEIKQLRIDRLKNHILINRFLNGYTYEDEEFRAIYDYSRINIICYEHSIKIKSIYNDDIIWFEFINYEPRTSWKFLSFYFCNNYNAQKMSPELPCDKK